MTNAIFSLIGLVVGAVLQFLITRYLDNNKHQRDMRAKAYADYLHCVCDQANIDHKHNLTEDRQLKARTADAKCRISLYGAPSVISKFAKFERLGATMRFNEGRVAFTDMVAEMRKDTLSCVSVNKQDLQILLMGFLERKV